MSRPPEAHLPLPRLPLTVAARRQARRGHTLQRLRRLAARNPQWWLLAIAAGAWIFLATASNAHAGHEGQDRNVWRDVLPLAVMVVAMMLPLTVGRVREMAHSSPWRRRHRAVAAFLAGYLAVWMLAIVLIDAAWRLAAARVEWGTAAIAVTGIAALWELAPRIRRQPAHPGATTSRGWRADASCTRLGVVSAGGCVASCWALMAACVAFAHSLPVMIVLFGVQLTGRHRPAASPALTALAVAGVCAASLVLRMASHHVM
jgi:type IV secretory pathway VirB2 component (pilin)